MEDHVTIPKEDWDALKADVKELKDSVDTLLTLWSNAQAIVVFVKYTAAVAAGLGTLYMFAKSLFQVKGL